MMEKPEGRYGKGSVPEPDYKLILGEASVQLAFNFDKLIKEGFVVGADRRTPDPVRP